jgi:hypothetical protein
MAPISHLQQYNITGVIRSGRFDQLFSFGRINFINGSVFDRSRFDLTTTLRYA